MPRSTPTQEYMTAVSNAVVERKGFKGDDELITALAESCWNHNWPLDKAHFQSNTIEFSDDDSTALDDYAAKAEEYRVALEKYDDDDDIDYDDADDPEGDDNMPAFTEKALIALGLDKDASEDDTLKAIAALKTAGFTEVERADLNRLKTASRVAHYTEMLVPLDGIPGTVPDNAAKLVKLEESLGEEEAMSRFKEWESMQSTLEAAGVTKALLYPTNPNEDVDKSAPAIATYNEFSEANKTDDDDENTVLRKLAESDPKAFMAYREARTGSAPVHQMINPSGRPR